MEHKWTRDMILLRGEGKSGSPDQKQDLEKYPSDPVILNKCYHNKLINVIYYWCLTQIFYNLSKISKAHLSKIVKVHLSPLKKSY